MIDALRRRRRLGLMLLTALCGWWLALISLPLFFHNFPQAPDPSDFSLYITGARVGLSHGWSHLYDVDLQRAAYFGIHRPTDPWGWMTYYVTPPPMAWLLAPLALLPYPVAFYTWAALNTVLFAVSGWAVLPGDRLLKITAIALSLTAYPFLLALQMGQVSILLACLAVLAWRLSKAGHDTLAGVVLSPLFVKPQVAHLVPLAFLLQRRFRLVAGLAAATALLVGLSLLSLGPDGVASWRRDLAAESGQLDNQVWTPAILVGAGGLALAVEVAAGLAAAATAWLAGRARIELGLAAALAGSLPAAPYHHAADSVALVVAAWFYARTRPPLWHAPWLAFGAVSVWFMAPLGPRPAMAFTLGWLLLMLWSALESRRALVIRFGARRLSRYPAQPSEELEQPSY